MSLSAYVNQHGIDAFTREDFSFVTSRVDKDPDRLVLVGGQSLETWGVFFDVPPPVGDGEPLTEDADWLGGKSDATWLCNLLGRLGQDVELQIAGANDNGPSSAMAYLRRPDGRVLMMDFLHAIVGLENEEIRRLAIPITVDGARLHVLHPLLCLESRLANLRCLPNKRQGNGPMQAEWAINIAAAYLRHIIGTVSVRQLIRACHKVAESAEYKNGRYCFVNFGLDPMRAVTPELVSTIGGKFESQDWPNTCKRIEEKRTHWLEVQRRQKLQQQEQ